MCIRDRKEIKGSVSGVEYDETLYTIRVQLSDSNATGKISVNVQVKNETTGKTQSYSSVVNGANTGCVSIPAAGITFTNRVTGGLSIEKAVAGDAGDPNKPFKMCIRDRTRMAFPTIIR